MRAMSPSKSQPALLGGVAIGVLSALPVINLANCCCAWILFGGALAAYLMQQNHPDRVSVGDGAIVGLMAGLIGTVIYVVLSFSLSIALGPWTAGMMERTLENARDMPPEIRAFLQSMQGGVVGGVLSVMSLMFFLCVGAIFGMLGGILGVLFFAKDGPPPPPPPTFEPPVFRPPPLPDA